MKSFWSILFSLFFLGLVVATFRYLGMNGLLRTEISWTDLVLLSLASFRLVRLFTYDHITEFIRDWIAPARSGTFVGTLKDLLGCPWCTGVWFGFIAYAGYCFNREAVMPIVLVLSIAALATLFQLCTNLVGWNAEEKKIEVRQKS
ncbi:MAG: hypothetical protein JWN64_508 [Parcubacteria group bacterium]|nr:hypothetical protein [Parcubacteria group bacterium]